ncbi:type II toxin-antitoxin system RelE/ParE family toxin [Eubacterium sp. am_0171]|uniref:type II toxin-antitoxin system RelE family toxin n=1 Tax=Clostridia TaxID=186801 RepID=UPI001021E974|nr:MULTISPECIES: type II toxin-antitoxin system RelE/ParE family toxin [unclassified Eubacterium (in: firmicutes)]MSC84100.1 type II toxin-antitoxin system RelE/ParE family toxin [Eubacterium sp. BIOML-A1]MSD06234.1 type II toxin-antitoxin system RelE/ParE family toxin [Eubacterium sp. BIOML-A2]RYT21475.1 type II toxin-antitoxin system RelE/ParE family toxin [Eubacterium sp. am_0171]
MTYKIDIDKKAQKFILKQQKDKRELIYKAIYNLPNGDVKALSGHKGFYRIRVGDYRVIYTIDNGIYKICIVDVGNRGDIYKRY